MGGFQVSYSFVAKTLISSKVRVQMVDFTKIYFQVGYLELNTIPVET